MATQTIVYRSTHLGRSFTGEVVAQAIKRIKYSLPRPCMLVSGGLIIAGMSIPFLMGLALIPASLLLGFVGMACACSGIVLILYYL